MADLVLHTGHSVLFGDSFSGGDGDITFSSGPVDPPPKIKQACAVCVVKTTSNIHDYDDVKLVPFGDKSGMLVSEVSDNASRNSDGGSSAAIAICEALMDIEAADVEVAAKKASLARAKLALLKAWLVQSSLCSKPRPAVLLAPCALVRALSALPSHVALHTKVTDWNLRLPS